MDGGYVVAATAEQSLCEYWPYGSRNEAELVRRAERFNSIYRGLWLVDDRRRVSVSMSGLTPLRVALDVPLHIADDELALAELLQRLVTVVEEFTNE